MNEFIKALRTSGYKMTPQRRAVIQALFSCDKFATAQDILNQVKLTHPDVSLDTIYRNLSLLSELGLIHEVQLRGREGNIFEIAKDGHHHHLICLTCGKAECMDYCPIHASDIAKAEEKGFEIVTHSLEFYGYCQACRNAG